MVIAKPVEELTALLGIELPVAPDVVLAGIKADGVILHWKPPEHKGVVVKYHIVVNGITGMPKFPGGHFLSVCTILTTSLLLGYSGRSCTARHGNHHPGPVAIS